MSVSEWFGPSAQVTLDRVFYTVVVSWRSMVYVSKQTNAFKAREHDLCGCSACSVEGF